MNNTPERRAPKGRKPASAARFPKRTFPARTERNDPRGYAGATRPSSVRAERSLTPRAAGFAPRGASAPRTYSRSAAPADRPFSPRKEGFASARPSGASAPFRGGARPTGRPSERSGSYEPRNTTRPFPPKREGFAPRGASAPFQGDRPKSSTGMRVDRSGASSHFTDSRSTPRTYARSAGRPSATPRTPTRAPRSSAPQERPSFAPRKKIVPQKPPRTRSASFSSAPATESWGNVAEWYHEHLGASDTYHQQVLLPHLLRLVDPKAKEKILDLACGEGFFTRAFHAKGAQVTGVDIGVELIEIAKQTTPEITYLVLPAAALSSIKKSSMDQVTIILAIQNIEEVSAVFTEAARVLRKDGTFHIVLNHPAFRIPKASSWEYDEKKKVQYRRVDGYLSDTRSEMDMHPGISGSAKTLSFHRPLQYYFKALAKAGFAVDRLEEWISHKASDSGPRAKAENVARKEIPLFLYLSAKKQ